MRSVSSYIESIREDKYVWALMLVKWSLAAVFVVQLVTLRENLNEMGCRYAVETVAKPVSENSGGALP